MLTRFDRQERLYQAIKLFRPIHLNLSRVQEAALAGTGLSLADRTVLECLIDHGAMTVPEAARKLSMKRQFVQRIVGHLIRAGLVEKQPNPEHKRAYLCAASAAGRRLFQDLHLRDLDLLHRHLGDINITEVIVALRVLNRLSATFEALAEDANAAGASDPG